MTISNRYSQLSSFEVPSLLATASPDDDSNHVRAAVAAARIRVIVVEGRALYACALASTVAAEPDMEVVAVLGDHEQMTPSVSDADVALIDLDMPAERRARAGRKIDEIAPRCRRVAVTSRPPSGPTPSDLHGLVSKHSSVRVLLETVRQVNLGGEVVDPRLTGPARRADVEALTKRELDLLTRAAQGSSIAELAAQLVLSEGTVRNYLSRAGTKLGARNRLQAICMVRDAGWL